MLRYSIDSIRAIFSKIQFIDIFKKFWGSFHYCFLLIANGAVESELEEDDVESSSNSGIERIIVVALTTFLFFVLVLYGASSAAGFVESLNPTGPE